MSRYCIVVTGPTGAGKTFIGEKLAMALGGEIINGDLGQLYAPLTIGTAKPDYRATEIPHHLFDSIPMPASISAMAFRKQVQLLCSAIWQRGKVPIVVGGSLYYIMTLFFPPALYKGTIPKRTYRQQHVWQELFAIDSQRAQEIDPHDIYRITRALDIWYATGIKPSAYKPLCNPIAPFVLLWVDRDRDELYRLIDQRVFSMIEDGWIEEVRSLLGTPWELFLLQKKIIGYPDIIAYCRGKVAYETMIQSIQKKTRNYAKRQITFGKYLKKQVVTYCLSDRATLAFSSLLHEVNLTHEPVDQYIKQLKSLLQNKCRGNGDE